MIYKNTNKIDLLNLTSNNFYVLMDFDRTITTSNSLGSWSVLENPEFVNEKIKLESKKLIEKYYPYETNYSLDFDTRLNYIEEWYNKNMNILYKYNLTHEALLNCVKYGNLILRDGFLKFIEILHKNNIPVFIISAGIGNVITEFMKLNNCLYENIFITSNFISFENNKMLPFSNSMIHSLNKTILSLPQEQKDILQKKDFCLLFGDLIDDLYMLPKNGHNNCVSFGFLEANITENFNLYKKSFDFVLTDNSTYFDVINILKTKLSIF